MSTQEEGFGAAAAARARQGGGVAGDALDKRPHHNASAARCYKYANKAPKWALGFVPLPAGPLGVTGFRPPNDVFKAGLICSSSA